MSPDYGSPKCFSSVCDTDGSHWNRVREYFRANGVPENELLNLMLKGRPESTDAELKAILDEWALEPAEKCAGPAGLGDGADGLHQRAKTGFNSGVGVP